MESGHRSADLATWELRLSGSSGPPITSANSICAALRQRALKNFPQPQESNQDWLTWIWIGRPVIEQEGGQSSLGGGGAL